MTRLDNYLVELNKITPGINIAFKNESLFMKSLGKILFFAPAFMTDFVTTLGKTIYLPSKEWVADQDDVTLLAVVSHEYRHVRDHEKIGFLFNLIYLFPLCLIPIIFTLLFVLSWKIVIPLVILCAAPVPAPGRTYFELRGYIMNMFVLNILGCEYKLDQDKKTNNLIDFINFINPYFTGFAYYVMWPFGVRNKLLSQVNIILSGGLPTNDSVYSDVQKALLASK